MIARTTVGRNGGTMAGMGAGGQGMPVCVMGVLLVALSGAVTGCAKGPRGRARSPAAGEGGTPYLLGMRFPIEPEGGYFPFFDSQLRGVHLTDARGKRFVLGVPAAEWGDRRLSLMTFEQDELEGEVMLYPGGAAERALLDGLREALTRGGPGTVPYAPEWHNGLGWDEREMFAHPLRYAELERRLANDEGRRQRRELLEARVGLAAARNRLTRAAGGAEPSGEDADAWW